MKIIVGEILITDGICEIISYISNMYILLCKQASGSELILNN